MLSDRQKEILHLKSIFLNEIPINGMMIDI